MTVPIVHLPCVALACHRAAVMSCNNNKTLTNCASIACVAHHPSRPGLFVSHDAF